MLSRSLATSFRSAVARPAVAQRAVAAVRFNSTASAEKEAGKDEAKSDAAPADESAKKISELEAKIKEQEKEMQYMRADYQTMSRRVTEERTKASDFAIAKFARDLTGTTHVLATALKHVPKPIESGSALEALADGVELTRKSLLQTLAHNGVVPMEDLVGSQFDPNAHEAIFQVPAQVAPKRADGAEPAPGEIIEVQKGGWMIKERVLTPAQVGVVQIE